jgi:hypothetical protein
MSTHKEEELSHKGEDDRAVTVVNEVYSLRHEDDVLLAKLGYRSEFRREFSVNHLSTTFSRHTLKHLHP